MTINEVLLLIFLLFTKHLIVDFPLQFPRHYLNKGKYMHLGGIEHAVLHGAGTALVVIWFAPPEVTLMISLVDALIHYHVDWAKMNLNAKLGYGPTTSEKFWWLLGLDQWLHAVTYIGLVAWLVL